MGILIFACLTYFESPYSLYCTILIQTRRVQRVHWQEKENFLSSHHQLTRRKINIYFTGQTVRCVYVVYLLKWFQSFQIEISLHLLTQIACNLNDLCGALSKRWLLSDMTAAESECCFKSSLLHLASRFSLEFIE